MTTETLSLVTERALSRVRGTTLILGSSVLFASSGPLAKPAMQAGLSPQQVAAVRIGLAAVVLFTAIAVVRPGLLRPGPGAWRLLLGYGLLGVAGVQFLYFVAVSRIPVGIAMLLEYLSPVLVVLWVRFVRGTVLPATAWLGTGLAIGGLALIAQVWQGLRLDLVGLLAGIGAALCSASYFLVGERALGTMHPLGIAAWGMLVGALGLAVLSPPWHLPTDLLGVPTTLGPWHPPLWTLLVAVALVSTVLAYTTGMLALRHLPSNVASVLALVEPVVATAAAWALLDEELTVVQIVGGVVLLTGALLVQRSGQPTDQRSPT